MEATVKEYMAELLENPTNKGASCTRIVDIINSQHGLDKMITRRAMEMVAHDEDITPQQLEARIWSRPRDEVMANPEDAR
jgi:hypothetical protein